MLLLHLLGLVGGLRLVDVDLGLDELGGHVLAPDPAGLGERADLQRDLVGELAEARRVRDEVGLAPDLDEHADAAVAVDVGIDDAFLGRSICARRLLGDAALAQQRDGGVVVARRLDERALAVHHAGAGRLAQDFDFRGRGV